MLSSDLTSVFPPKSFIQNVQESNPKDCEVEAWARGRLKCLPDAKDIEKDSMVATHVSQAKEDEAKVVFRNAAFSGTHVVKDDAEGAAPVVAFKKRAVKPKGKRNSRRKTDDA